MLLLYLQFTACIPSFAQNGFADEYEIRAAMLFNLTKFIEWPPWKMNASPIEFSVCVLGADPLSLELDTFLRNKTVGTKPMVVRHLTSVDLASGCHILYVGASERKNVLRAFANLADHAVLTISERPNADSPEQIIGLPTADDHVRIDVNLGAARRSGLTISSKLLHLATVKP